MNDVIINKVGSIQRCIRRARDEYQAAGSGFADDFTRQDAALLNVTRACEQAIDCANHVIRKKKLGVPADSAESFLLLHRAGILPRPFAVRLVKMTGFRNIVIHEYQAVNIDVVISVITKDLDDLVLFTEYMLRLDLPA